MNEHLIDLIDEISALLYPQFSDKFQAAQEGLLSSTAETRLNAIRAYEAVCGAELQEAIRLAYLAGCKERQAGVLSIG